MDNRMLSLSPYHKQQHCTRANDAVVGGAVENHLPSPGKTSAFCEGRHKCLLFRGRASKFRRTGQNTENSKEKRAGDGPMGLALAKPSKLSLGMLGWDSGNPHFSFTSWLPGRLQRLQDLLLPLQFCWPWSLTVTLEHTGCGSAFLCSS